MPVTWKRSSRFKPAVVLDRVAAARTVNPEGGASFEGFDLEDCLPALQSMLNFPDAALGIDAANLVWRGLATVKGELNKDSFIAAVNAELSEKLAVMEETYYFLTTISVDHRSFPKKLSVDGAFITLYPSKYPARFVKARSEVLSSQKVPVPTEPDNYCRVVVKVKAKGSKVAVNRALRAIDLQRSLWCLMGNSRMEIAFGGSEMNPISRVRLGSKHTIHLKNGSPAEPGMWFEPGFKPAKLFHPENRKLNLNSKWALRRIQQSKYGEKIVTSLLRFVRALDETEANTAFLQLWGALEMLTTPDKADYDCLVKRCSFLFKDTEYHRQLLEHLHEYRNASVHAGEGAERARTHCFQLQLYFVNLIWFHLQNAKVFPSLQEANEFLDLPADKTALQNRLHLTKKTIKFIG